MQVALVHQVNADFFTLTVRKEDVIRQNDSGAGSTGIFYAQGVKTNVLFFTRGRTDKGGTQEVWFYDLRTNMPSFGKTNPLKTEHFTDFEAAFEAADRRAVQDERWNVFTREQIAQKGNSLDLGFPS